MKTNLITPTKQELIKYKWKNLKGSKHDYFVMELVKFISKTDMNIIYWLYCLHSVLLYDRRT
jgi:hypothetical protein